MKDDYAGSEPPQASGQEPEPKVASPPLLKPARRGYGYGYSGYGYPAGGAYGSYGDAPQRPEIHILDYVRILYRRRGTAVAVLVLVLAGAFAYSHTLVPIYEGRVQILIEPENPNIVNFKEVLDQDKTSYEYYETQYKILQSRLLARKTIDAMKLRTEPAFIRPKAALSLNPVRWLKRGTSWAWSLVRSSPPPETARPQTDETAADSALIDQFLRALKIKPVVNSRLVDVRYESTDPKLAAAVANQLAHAYIDQNLVFKYMASKDASAWLAGQLAQQRKRVEESEMALQHYRERGDAVALEDRQNIVVQRLADLNAAVTKARTDRIEKEALFNRLTSLESDRAALDTFPAVLSNSYVQSLKTQLADLERQQAQLSERLGENHPEMARAVTAVKTARARLDAEIAKVVQAVKNEFLAAQAQEQSLTTALEGQKAEALSLNRRGIEYGVLRREAESNRQVYDSLLQRASETGVSGELKTSNIKIVDEAEVPLGPVRPNRRRIIWFGAMFGLVAGIALALFLEYLDNRIKSPDEIKAHLGLPFLGLIPSVRPPLHVVPTMPLINNGVPANFAEAFRGLRTSLVFSSADEGSRSLVVTSTGPGEGKTLVAANVAHSLSQAGEKVLLIDCDLRRSSLHPLFGLEQSPGLTDFLTGQAQASQVVKRIEGSNLWVLPAGTSPPNPAELLGSRRFRAALDAFRQHFEWVIIDSPPVLAVTDGVIVGHQASGVLFVVGCEMTNRHAAAQAVEQLLAAKAKVTGAVLNRVNVERNAYYYSHYYKHEYRSYYERDHQG